MSDLLAARGFKASGSTASRSLALMTHVVMFEWGKYRSVDSYPVTAMLAVVSEEAAQALSAPVAEFRSEPMRCPWWSRIGSVMPARRDHWWDLGTEGSTEETEGIAGLVDALRDAALPQFDTVGTEAGLLDYLEGEFQDHGSRLYFETVGTLAVLARAAARTTLADAAMSALAQQAARIEEAAELYERLTSSS